MTRVARRLWSLSPALAAVLLLSACQSTGGRQGPLEPLSATAAEAMQVAGLDANGKSTAEAEADDATLKGDRDPSIEAEVNPTVVIEPPELRRPSGVSWAAVGALLLREADYVQAERAFNRALAAGDVRRETMAGMGVAAAGQGHFARAERYLKAALVLAPEDADTHAALGTLLAQRRDYEAARRHLRTAFVVSSGEHSIAARTLAYVEARLAERKLRDAEADEAVAFRTQRMGRNEYRLISLENETWAPAGPVPGLTPAVAALLRGESLTTATDDTVLEGPVDPREAVGAPDTAARREARDPEAETAAVDEFDPRERTFMPEGAALEQAEDAQEEAALPHEVDPGERIAVPADAAVLQGSDDKDEAVILEDLDPRESPRRREGGDREVTVSLATEGDDEQDEGLAPDIHAAGGAATPDATGPETEVGLPESGESAPSGKTRDDDDARMPANLAADAGVHAAP